MIIKLKNNVTKDQINELEQHLIKKGFEIHESFGKSTTIIGVIGDTTTIDPNSLYAYEYVDTVLRVQEAFKKVNRKFKPEDTVVDVAGIKIGSKNVVVIGGPCAVESNQQIEEITPLVIEAGAKILRGGAYKPRTSPYSFQGLEQEGLEILNRAKNKYKIPVVSEIMSIDDIDLFVKNVDLIQVGARNMQNFALLKELGKLNKPILLKRGIANTIEEWLMSAEYILAGGNTNVILCERGIRTFESSTRNTLDLSSIPVIKKLSHLPIIVDPSHAAGRWEYIESLSLASIAAGADGLIVEVHQTPETALSDGQQSLKPEKFKNLISKCRKVAEAIDRTLE
ncbi:MAG: 3-deoxy-7-phosphoheptulonate synthase [Candidatus Izemoplasmatales bacterium]|jgi:3-deoxy-7-phosphoheptulonate synthase|nr:3-deoxy-7-phosphoheptulonate synthase [Candidatus Izemoplasmatales bacterium]